MKEIKLGNFIRLGVNLRYFEDLRDGRYSTNIKKAIGSGIGLRDSLIQEERIIKDLGLCNSTLKEIEEILRRIENGKYEKFDNLNLNDRTYFNDVVVHWYDRLKTKANDFNVVILDNNYTLNPTCLKGGAKEFFSESIWNKLPKLVKRDIDESCRCLLFELPTPSGILALRATEEVLRKFYQKKTNQTPPANMNWYRIICALRRTNTDQTLLGHLDYLRKGLRNKLNHPDAVLNQKEAENIFSMIINSIETMVKG